MKNERLLFVNLKLLGNSTRKVSEGGAHAQLRADAGRREGGTGEREDKEKGARGEKLKGREGTARC